MFWHLSLADNRLCGVWKHYGVTKGTYDATGIQAIAAALRGSSVLTKLDFRNNYLNDATEQSVRDAAASREGFVLLLGYEPALG